MSCKSYNLEALRSIIESQMGHYIVLYKNGKNKKNDQYGKIVDFPIGIKESPDVTQITISKPNNDLDSLRWYLILPEEPNYDSSLLYWKVEEIIEEYIRDTRSWYKGSLITNVDKLEHHIKSNTSLK